MIATNNDDDGDEYPAKFMHHLKLKTNPKTDKSRGRRATSVYRAWYNQLRETDAALHSRAAFLSAIVPTITPTNGDRSALPRPAMIENSRTPFMSKEITDYIQKTNVTHWLKYSAKNIRGRSVNVHIMHCGGGGAVNNHDDDDDSIRCGIPVDVLARYRSYVYKIYAWFHFIHPSVAQDSDCSKTINLYFYFTPFEKQFPRTAGRTLGPVNANTGFTYSCASNPHPGGKKSTEIIIFRHEEWFKVLLHETLHNLELDFNTHAGTSLRDIFPGVRHEILLSEAYVETWARLINLGFYVFYDIYGGNGTAAEYNLAVQRCLSAECAFSLFQADATLQYMGLSMQKLLDRDDSDVAAEFAKKYSENTNIFAYYVLAGMMVFEADEFIGWCTENNAFSLIQAPTGASGGTVGFKKLIDRLSKSERIKQTILNLPESRDIDDGRTMRMTLWH